MEKCDKTELTDALISSYNKRSKFYDEELESAVGATFYALVMLAPDNDEDDDEADDEDDVIKCERCNENDTFVDACYNITVCKKCKCVVDNTVVDDDKNKDMDIEGFK